MNPDIILINPWIYDFAAFDLWSKPLGLLYIAGYLKKLGFNMHLIDCMDVHHPVMEARAPIHNATRRRYGTGKYWRQPVSAPGVLCQIKRVYSRYGITRELFINELQKMQTPSAILVTSLMTYWYPGVVEAVSIAREVHPGVPVILGGIYARLCEEHAMEFSGADYVSTDTALPDMGAIDRILTEFNITIPRAHEGGISPLYPALDLLNKPDYACIMTSAGCPYRCRYCASGFLYPKFFRRDPLEIIEEIRWWSRCLGLTDFAFYDDALLIDSERHAAPIMEGIVRSGLNLRFHTPNALHIKEISREMAALLKASGFCTIRLGLETSDMERHDNLDRKVSEGDFEMAVRNLKKAGFNKEEIGAYVLMGLPGQSVKSVEDTIRFVGAVGVVPYLAEYSPIPHTSLWDESIMCSSYDLSKEPLFHNNTLLPCWDEEKRQKVPALRRMVKEIKQGI